MVGGMIPLHFKLQSTLQVNKVHAEDCMGHQPVGTPAAS